MGWRRYWDYLKIRVARIKGSPYAIAAGFAAGSAVSFTPLMGFHFMLGFVLAWITRASYIASAIGTVVGNPWTFPFIWVLIYGAGVWVLEATHEVPFVDAFISYFFGMGWFEKIVEQSFTLDAIFNDFDGTVSRIWSKPVALLFPMLVGGVPVGVVAWFLSFLPVYFFVKSFRASREQRMALRHGKDHATKKDKQ